MPKYFGCHVSASGGLENCLTAAETLKINTIQIHASPPQRWNSKPFAPGIEDAFNAKRAASGVEKFFFHAIYLINLANPDPQQQSLSRLSLLHHLDLNARMNGDGVIFHLGSLKDEPDMAVGFQRAAESINWVMERADKRSRLLLEVAAGSGKVIGAQVEDLATIYQGVECKERVGYALDTQHMWASGYNLSEDLDSIIVRIDASFSLGKVWAIHLNDSKTELASRKDRHENLGDGLIGAKTIESVFMHPKLSEIPFILETPAMKDLESAQTEVAKLRQMIDAN